MTNKEIKNSKFFAYLLEDRITIIRWEIEIAKGNIWYATDWRRNKAKKRVWKFFKMMGLEIRDFKNVPTHLIDKDLMVSTSDKMFYSLKREFLKNGGDK